MTRVLLGFAAVFAVLLLAIRLIYGGGVSYIDVNTAPLLQPDQLDIAFSSELPIGNVASAADGTLFFTIHPDAKPAGNKLLRIVDGIALPFPDGASQQNIFNTPLGLTLDAFNRLWVIDHGNHATQGARLLAIDLANGDIVHDHTFSQDIAPTGSMLQDLAVSDDGQTVFIADVSIIRRKPALIVYDTTTSAARRVLEGVVATSSQDYRINNSYRRMVFLGGLFSLMPGLDGLALSQDGEWLYLAAMSNDGLYRVPAAAAADATVHPNQLAKRVERFGDKPLSDGVTTDAAGNIYVTDVEHHSITRIDPRRRLQTVLRSPRIRWPDSVALDAANNLYVADSALPLYLLQSDSAIADNAPYHIFRIPLTQEPTTEP
ncbi:MAG: L-dopachrome tautomerase-related protein [Pseudomonadota bacterium]